MLYVLLSWLVIFIGVIVFFIFRKNKHWFNYVAFAGELLFLVEFLFRIQHYPWQMEISLAGSVLLITAFIAILQATKQNKIPSSLLLGAVLCLYVLMTLNLVSTVLRFL